jgi:dihydroorotate dehydrogenase electron transfer subunit
MAQQIVSEILDNRRVGDYHVLSLTAPGVAESVQPGHFVTMAMGGEESSMVLRRAFAIHQVTSRGVYGGTLDVAIAVQGRGTKWLSERRRHDIVNLVGPLGRPFTLPKQGVSCVLVGGGSCWLKPFVTGVVGWTSLWERQPRTSSSECST